MAKTKKQITTSLQASSSTPTTPPPTADTPPQPASQATQSTQPVPALLFLPDESIGRHHLEQVKSILKKSSNKQLYLIVKSHGGDAYSAVRILRHIRTKYDNIIGIVPDYAYSAATLMLLGTNKIYVAPEGYIGPIDKPTEHSASGEAISALDVTQSVANLSSLVSETAVSFYKEIRGPEARMSETVSKKDALETAWTSAVKLMCPLIEKIDPVLLQKSYRDLRIGMYYGMDLLTESMLKGNRGKAFRVVQQLVNLYPSHGYAIFREEMKNLGLIVANLESNPDEAKIKELYSKNNSGIIFKEDIYA